MLDVIAILGLSVAVVALVWITTCRGSCRVPCKWCRIPESESSRDVVTIQVDLSSGKIRTCHDNSLALAPSQSALQVTQVSSVSQPVEEDREAKLTTPTRIHDSRVTTATQTNYLPSPLDSSEYSAEVTTLNKSTWTIYSSDTSHGSNSDPTTDTSRSFTNTTFFEESKEATKQLNDTSIHRDNHEASRTIDMIELDRLVTNASSCSSQVNSGSPGDSSLGQSTLTLLAKSNSSSLPDLAAVCPLDESTETLPQSDIKDLPLLFQEENEESQCQAPDSDLESYYTCEEASEREEVTPTRGKMSFFTDAAHQLEAFKDINWVII